ncbi:MAG TPA: DUF5682 family protein [Symbiobacteriaceae bacterium]|nr:DUF5682 family protein [Symbiobacteriaceae bacterium]
MLIFPVRHHSPTAALQVRTLIRKRRPRLVLVEGPADATPLIPLLLDRSTAPPVAVYAYRTGAAEVRAAFWPFCDYSPEYAALQAGQEVGAQLAFCDLPAAMTLAAGREEAGGSEYGRFAAGLAEAAGYDSFEEFWETAFEQEAGQGTPEGYIEVLGDFGTKARALSAGDEHNDLRERHMAATALNSGVAPAEIAIVCGAAHAEKIAAAVTGGSAAFAALETATVEVVLVPYSFPRLSEQSGYGAGNRAPWFYQRVWELKGDYRAATRATLAALAGRLRKQGHQASLAQTIDAYNLARTLAHMREKPAPGVDEVTEAATACFGQGRTTLVTDALRHVLIGETVGRVTHKVGKTPLQTEFYAEANRLRLPILDTPQQILVHLPVAAEAEQSAFLHRLGVASIPFAREIESGLGGRGRDAAGGPLEQLSRVREKWELQWRPETDAELVERTALGNTLAEVCGRVLNQRLAEAPHIDTGAEVLLKMALCEVTAGFDQALEQCEALAADSASFTALARAAYYLDGLISYGSARRLPAERLTALAERLFARAVLHLPAAAICGDEAAQEADGALKSLYDLVARGAAAADVFWESVETVSRMVPAHPALRGLCLVLLELGGRLAPGALAAQIRYWLSATAEAPDNARLVAGLFSLHRSTLVRNRTLIGAVTEFLSDLSMEQLVPLLPVLRRNLGNLTAAERTYLAETLEAVLGLGGGEASRTLRLSAIEEELLREADRAAAHTLAEWRARYGIG